MFWVGLLITAADVLIALALANFGAKSAAKTQALEQSGVLALAQITGMRETGTRINDQPLVKLQLQIEGPGIAPFATQDRVIASVTRLPHDHQPKTGRAGGPGHAAVPNRLGTKRFDQRVVPATFTIAEDNRTYDLSGQTGALMEILQILKANGIGMNNMIDLRSNPAARQQVQAVVRRAAAAQAPAAPAPAAAGPGAPPQPYVAPPEPSTSQRLQELETLRATGAISDSEYNAKRHRSCRSLDRIRGSSRMPNCIPSSRVRTVHAGGHGDGGIAGEPGGSSAVNG